MFSRRYTIAVSDLRSGIERRTTVSLSAVLVALGATVTLPMLIGLGAAWKVRIDTQGLHARNRALEIETSNYRAATEALAEQIESLQATAPDVAKFAGPFESARIALTAGKPIVPSSSVPSARPVPLPALAPEPGSPAAIVTPAAAAEGSGVNASSGSSPERGAFMEALARSGRRRALAEDAEAPALASRSYQAGVALEGEAQQLSTAGRMADALVRAVAADARFRAAEVEARAEAAARERSRLAGAPTPGRPSTVEAREASAQPTDSLRSESSQPARAQGSVAVAVNVENAILGVIAQYVSGLESRNLAALKRVWPSLGGNQERALRAEFENARTVQAVFQDPRITTNDDTTTVTGVRRYSLETYDGQRLSTVTRTTITLRRSGESWVIERVVHHQ